MNINPDLIKNVINVDTSINDKSRVNFIKGKNLFNINDIAPNSFLDSNTGNISSNTSWSTSNYIEVSSSTSYVLNYVRSGTSNTTICFYDSNKAFISSTSTSTLGLPATFTTPSNAKYLRFDYRSADNQTNIQLEKGALTSYKPFVPSSIYVDNEKFTETVGVGSSVNGANRVNFIKSKNLFNGNSFSNRSGNGVTTTFNNSEITFNGTTSGAGNIYTDTYGFYLEAGTYTFKFSRKSGTYTANGGSSAIIIKKTGGTEIKHFEFYYFVVGNSYSYTFTLDSKTQIGIQIYANSSNQVFSNLILEVQFEKGSSATYEPYVTPSIVVDNEEIYTKGQNEEYSTFEQRIGTWMGKPLYRKVFTITSLTSSNTNLVDVSGLLIDFAKISGTIITSTGAKFPINLYDSATNYSVIILSDSGYIRGRAAIGSGTLSKCIVILEYTKTTD